MNPPPPDRHASDAHAIREGSIEISTGRLHFERAGAGPPLLLIHGLVGSSRNWRRNLPALAEHHTVFALDLPNMGASARIPGLDPGLRATARRLVQAMDHLGLTTADIVASSHGGAVALMLAALFPERVGRLVLFAPANPFCTRGERLIRFYRSRSGLLLARSIPWLPPAVKQIALARMFGNPALIAPGTLRGYTDGLRIPGTIRHVLGIVRRWSEDMADLRSELPKLVSRSMLLVWGDRDSAVGLDSAHVLRSVLPLARLHILPGAGHIPYEEVPDVCNGLILDWLGERNTRRPPSPAHPLPPALNHRRA